MSVYRANLAIILVVMQLSKRIPFDDPTVLMAVRGAYVAANLVIFGLYFYVQAQIKKKKGELH